MDLVLICSAAFAASVLTFFAGYGLGTILLPVFSLFFPVEIAIAMTAVVHLLNNLFKTGLVGKDANLPVVLKFGIPSMIASFAGALLLLRLAQVQPVGSYSIGDKIFELHPLKITVGIVLLFMALLEWFPNWLVVKNRRGILFTGGLLSGFFGGLTGNQGALRSAFLLRAGLPKTAFIATGVLIACMVDIARIFVYSGRFSVLEGTEKEYLVMGAASLAAFTGALAGNRLLKKMTLKMLQLIVTVLLIIYSILLAGGII